MRHRLIAIAVVLGMVAIGLVASPVGVRAHEQETSVDWVVAYANIQTLAPPVFTHYTTQTCCPLSSARGTTFAYTGMIGASGALPGEYPRIASGSDPGLKTGDYIDVTWSFHYVATAAVRGDLFWITRLGLDFSTIGRYITCTPPAGFSPTGTCPGTRQWIGASSFSLEPDATYDAELVIRSIQPNFRHLHVGVSVQNVGNIPAAPTVNPIPAGGPILYGAFTDASGPVVEPLEGINVAGSPFSGTFLLLTPWPWAVAGLVGQIVIGFVFIGVMYWYGRFERKRGAGT